MFQGSIDIPSTALDGVELNRALCALVAMHMEREKIQAVSLADIPGVKHKNVRKRLQAGNVSWDELNILMRRLGIDEKRAFFTVYFYNDPERYFTDVCAFVTRYVSDVSVLLDQSLSAMNGDFDPIREQLCSCLAERTVQEVMKHQKRVNDVRHSAIE